MTSKVAFLLAAQTPCRNDLFCWLTPVNRAVNQVSKFRNWFGEAEIPVELSLPVV